jgi:hypothetical protein
MEHECRPTGARVPERIVRTMFAVYTLIIVTGIGVYLVVGLGHY